MVRFFGLLLLSLPLCANDESPLPQRIHQYQVKIDKALSIVDVSICFAGSAPNYLKIDDKSAIKKLKIFPKSTAGYIEFQGRYWKTSVLPDDTCIHYQSDISSYRYLVKEIEEKKLNISFQSENTWLWLPENLSTNESVEIFFELPGSYQISTPWQLKQNGKKHHFVIGKAPHDWGFTLMIGEFDFAQIQLSNSASINLAMMPQLKQTEHLKRWIVDSYMALLKYGAGTPTEQLQVILIENSRFKKGPVPWGDVKRGGGNGIRFVVNSDEPIETFYTDWTATHEFSHLLLPNIEYQDIWLSEGLASYLQYVMMAQSGVIDELTAWQKIYDGLLRGEKATANLLHETLLQTSEKRKSSSGFERTMRIYWSGAAYFMLADIKLRNMSDGKIGLPNILRKLNQCCLNTSQKWNGKALSEKLDQLSNSKIFSQLYLQMAYSKDFPSMQEAFHSLGIKINSNNRLSFKQQSNLLRKNIMQPIQN